MPTSSFRITRKANPDIMAGMVERSMTNLGGAIAARAQRIVPKRTWALHDSITTKTERRGPKVVTEVGAGGGDVDYALYVERGTSRQRAQPYLRPALLQSVATDLASRARPKKHGRATTRRKTGK